MTGHSWGRRGRTVNTPRAVGPRRQQSWTRGWFEVGGQPRGESERARAALARSAGKGLWGWDGSSMLAGCSRTPQGFRRKNHVRDVRFHQVGPWPLCGGTEKRGDDERAGSVGEGDGGRQAEKPVDLRRNRRNVPIARMGRKSRPRSYGSFRVPGWGSRRVASLY